MEAKMEPVIFRRWSNKKWAVLATFHKVILIGTLSFSYQMLAQETGNGQPDTTLARILVELEEVETTGEWPAELEDVSLKPVVLVTSRDIGAAAATSHEDLLEYLPQVDIRQRGKHGTQADLTIQGGSFDQSMILLNGINLSDPQTGHFHLNLPLDLNSTEQIEVVTGSATRRFGTNAFSGAVNVVTRPADSTFLNAGLRAGQYSFYKAHFKANVSGKHSSTLISSDVSGSKGYRENTDFQTNHAYLHSAIGYGKLKTHIMAGLNTRKFGANAFYTPVFVHQYEETKTGFGAVKMVLSEARSHWTFNAFYKLNRDHFLLDRQDPAFYNNDHFTQVTGVNTSGRFSTMAGITRSGLYYRREQIKSTSLGESLDPDQITTISDTITFTHGHVRTQFNWNLNHTWETGPLTLSGGFMLHFNSDLDYKPRIFPGIDIRYRLPASIMIYASINQSMRLPTFTDLYYQGPSNVGNPELLPEKATTYELGVYRQVIGLYLGVNGFYRQGKDMIDWIWMEDDKWHTTNLTAIDAVGGDLSVKYLIDVTQGKMIQMESGEFSYSFTHLTRVTDQVISRYLLDNLRHKVVLGTSLNIARSILLSAKLTGQDRNGSYLAYNPDNGESAEQPFEPFLLMDLKLGYSFRRIHIFTEVTNLFDASYNDIGNVIQPGRWIMAGFEIR